jgi:hypothetical protein
MGNKRIDRVENSQWRTWTPSPGRQTGANQVHQAAWVAGPPADRDRRMMMTIQLQLCVVPVLRSCSACDCSGPTRRRHSWWYLAFSSLPTLYLPFLVSRRLLERPRLEQRRRHRKLRLARCSWFDYTVLMTAIAETVRRMTSTTATARISVCSSSHPSRRPPNLPRSGMRPLSVWKECTERFQRREVVDGKGSHSRAV